MSSPNTDELGRLIAVGVEAVIEDGLNDNGQPRTHADELEAFKNETRFLRTRSTIWGALVVLFVAALAFVFAFENILADWSWSDSLPKNPIKAADKLLEISPIIVRRFKLVMREWLI
jgi:membrane dipeptidase